MNISSTTFYISVGVIAALLITFIILLIIVLVKQSKLNNKYIAFMGGSDAASMEKVILKRFVDIDRLIAADARKDIEIKEIKDNLCKTYQ